MGRGWGRGWERWSPQKCAGLSLSFSVVKIDNRGEGDGSGKTSELNSVARGGPEWDVSVRAPAFVAVSFSVEAATFVSVRVVVSSSVFVACSLLRVFLPNWSCVARARVQTARRRGAAANRVRVAQVATLTDREECGRERRLSDTPPSVRVARTPIRRNGRGRRTERGTTARPHDRRGRTTRVEVCVRPMMRLRVVLLLCVSLAACVRVPQCVWSCSRELACGPKRAPTDCRLVTPTSPRQLV